MSNPALVHGIGTARTSRDNLRGRLRCPSSQSNHGLSRPSASPRRPGSRTQRLRRSRWQVFGLAGVLAPKGRLPIGRRFPVPLEGPVRRCAVRSCLPLRGSSGFPPDSLLAPGAPPRDPGEPTCFQYRRIGAEKAKARILCVFKPKHSLRLIGSLSHLYRLEIIANAHTFVFVITRHCEGSRIPSIISGFTAFEPMSSVERSIFHGRDGRNFRYDPS